jgi:hypothetical protein
VLAGVAYRLDERSRLIVVDIGRRPAEVRSISLGGIEVFGDVHWLPDGSLLLTTSNSRYARVLDRDLRTRSRFRWSAQEAVVTRSTAYGIRGVRRTLVAAPLPEGPMRVLRRLPGAPEALVAADS